MNDTPIKKVSSSDSAFTVDLQPLVMPVALVLSSIIISAGMFLSAGRIQITVPVQQGNTATAANPTPTADDTTQQQQQPTVSIEKIKALFNKDHIMFGDPNSKLLLVEVSDPSCPYCHVAAGKNPELNAQISEQFKLDTDGGKYLPPVREMKKLVDEGKAAFVFIYSNGHGNGELATQALYCGNEKGKFWQVHDLLMTNAGYNLINNDVKNDKGKSQVLADFLKSAVDSNEMKSCLESGKYADKIKDNQSTARSLGVGGTPGFFVNETNFAGAYSFEDMKSAVEAALK